MIKSVSLTNYKTEGIVQKKNDKLHFNDTVCLTVYTYQDLLKKVLSTAQTLKVNGFPHQTLVAMTAQAKHDPFQIRQVNWKGIEMSFRHASKTQTVMSAQKTISHANSVTTENILGGNYNHMSRSVKRQWYRLPKNMTHTHTLKPIPVF